MNVKSLEVLVVDDEPAIRQVLAAHLGSSGCSVSQAGNGGEAIERLAKGDIDVVISDIKMPDFNGIELVRRARAAGIDFEELCWRVLETTFSRERAVQSMEA